ncbi:MULTISPECIES: WGR domain-containing protein [Leptospira]|uniref:Leucine rich repeat protein n=3 Tax=Leptospira borgpetersenii TaxID=174 RepID=M3GSY6_LEPBO|nr:MULTISPECIES: WGR domain-containing protein [Leptospira]EKP14184.1 leucine rich repeat protein [Leptospira borgpetersenii str. 200801926]EMF97948.1 leucine rich repeat protein [Leptospira borgpetersenii str. 200701203]EMK13111.1 leucine rich repeat protein [Leptospira sp. serovar Kenya str. Sh9]ENO63636.1 leucine rich repeat protein [Leptospira borgpetersenii serovar Mini str. 201000851]
MKKYLIYQDEGSKKFWSIQVSGSTFTVTFGKIGSSGQSSTKTFSDEKECLKEAEKLFREKLKKGYVETELTEQRSETELPEQNSEPIQKLLSDSFHQFLKVKVKDFEESKYAKTFQKINWEKEAEKVFQSVCSYWKKLKEKNIEPIGIFDIRWDDAATQYSIEFDYDTGSNDPKNAMEEGAVDNESVIDFSDLIRKNLKEEPDDIWETMGEDYTVMQNILCKMSKEIILQTLKENSFLQIEKQTPYYLIFAYYHDDEESEVIFDSSGKIKNSPYPELTKKGIDLSKLYNSKDKSMLIEDRNLEEIPDEIGDYQDLETLSCWNTKIAKLPNTITALQNLKDLSIISKKLTEFPIEICKLSNLRYLYIRTEKINKLPEDVGALVNLNHLNLCGNKLKDLPKNLQKLTLLKRLNLGENKFEKIPTALYGMNSIEELDLRHNPFKSLDGIGKITGLITIHTYAVGIKELTPEIGQLKNCKYFHLSDVDIEEIPKEIGDMDSMYTLEISKTKIRFLPDTIGKLKNCKSLDIQKNQIEFLPETIGTMENLEELSAGNNKLTDLPESIYQLKKLKEIGLWGNSFSQDQKAKIVSRLKENIPGIKINIDK